MKYDFENKVVLITGGSGAIGRAVAKAFLASKATVIATYVVDREAEVVKSEMKEATLIKADVTNEDEIKKLASGIVEKFARIDILINVVGGYLGGKSVAALDMKEWDIMMNINLKSAFLISKYVIPVMASAKYGKIVHISSRTGLKSDGYDSAYAASKSGLIRLVESISEEVKALNINVNCVMPSIVDTEANRKAVTDADFSKWVKTEDLANVILFLASDESKAIHGAAIPVYALS